MPGNSEIGLDLLENSSASPGPSGCDCDFRPDVNHSEDEACPLLLQEVADTLAPNSDEIISHHQRSISCMAAVATTALAATMILASLEVYKPNKTNETNAEAVSLARLLKNNKNKQEETSTIPILNNVGDKTNLLLCQGDCDDDSDCLGYPDLVCYQRDEMEVVPGCTAGSGSLYDTKIDFCIKPTLPILQSSSVGGELGRCEGYCNRNSDCQDGLKCYRRNGRNRVPGCQGTGQSGMNYCYDPNFGANSVEGQQSSSGGQQPNSANFDTFYDPNFEGNPIEGQQSSSGGQQSNSAGDYDTFSFYCLGDIPYSTEEEKILEEQLEEADDGDFVVHVGDIMYAMESDCEEWRYERVSTTFQRSSVSPLLVVPGDNEFGDCSDNEEGMNHWHNHLGKLAHRANWRQTSVIPSLIQRQDERSENFAFVHKGVLFMGINMIYGRENGWQERIQHNRSWIIRHLNQNVHGKSRNEAVRAVILFAHSHSPFSMIEELMEDYGPEMKSLDIPFIFMHGNGHKYRVGQPFQSELNWSDFVKIQVDQGRIAPPVKVTVQGTTAEALSKPLRAWSSDQRMLAEFIKLDRRL